MSSCARAKLSVRVRWALVHLYANTTTHTMHSNTHGTTRCTLHYVSPTNTHVSTYVRADDAEDDTTDDSYSALGDDRAVARELTALQLWAQLCGEELQKLTTTHRHTDPPQYSLKWCNNVLLDEQVCVCCVYACFCTSTTLHFTAHIRASHLKRTVHHHFTPSCARV